MELPFQLEKSLRIFDHLFSGNPRDLQTDFDVRDQPSSHFKDSADVLKPEGSTGWGWVGGWGGV